MAMYLVPCTRLVIGLLCLEFTPGPQYIFVAVAQSHWFFFVTRYNFCWM